MTITLVCPICDKPLVGKQHADWYTYECPTTDRHFYGTRAATEDEARAILYKVQKTLVDALSAKIALPIERRRRDAAAKEIERLRALLDTPELDDFAKGVVLEAQHQRARWGAKGDAGKTPMDWFWLLGYLGGKIVAACAKGDRDKALHHCVSTAAALANWHAAIKGVNNDMRPGIEEPKT